VKKKKMCVVHLDNARGHISKESIEFFDSLGMKCLDFGGHPRNDIGGVPPNSPDLSAIEYVFNLWQNNVAKRKPQTVEKLRQVAEEEWSAIDIEFVRKCMKHMIKVYEWVRRNKCCLYGCKLSV
jgi:hypothetical protein